MEKLEESKELLKTNENGRWRVAQCVLLFVVTFSYSPFFFIPINRPLSRYSCSAKVWSNTWIKHTAGKNKPRLVSAPIFRVTDQSTMLLRKMFRNTTSNPLEFFFLRRISRSSVINWLNKQMNEQMVTQQRYGPFELHSKISTRSNGRGSFVLSMTAALLFVYLFIYWSSFYSSHLRATRYSLPHFYAGVGWGWGPVVLQPRGATWAIHSVITNLFYVLQVQNENHSCTAGGFFFIFLFFY